VFISVCLIFNHNLLNIILTSSVCASFTNLFNLFISNSNYVKFGTALTRARCKTPVKFEIHWTNSSRDMRITDTHTHTSRQTDVPVIYI